MSEENYRACKSQPSKYLDLWRLIFRHCEHEWAVKQVNEVIVDDETKNECEREVRIPPEARSKEPQK
jgi:hypothetical protein